jgi:hypothetical protein
MKFFITGLALALSFANAAMSVWDHNPQLIAAWTVATLAWLANLFLNLRDLK